MGEELAAYSLDILRSFGAWGAVVLALSVFIWWLLRDRERQRRTWTQIVRDKDQQIRELTSKCFQLHETLGDTGARYREATTSTIEFLRGTKK